MNAALFSRTFANIFLLCWWRTSLDWWCLFHWRCFFYWRFSFWLRHLYWWPRSEYSREYRWLFFRLDLFYWFDILDSVNFFNVLFLYNSTLECLSIRWSLEAKNRALFLLLFIDILLIAVVLISASLWLVVRVNFLLTAWLICRPFDAVGPALPIWRFNGIYSIRAGSWIIERSCSTCLSM